MQRSTRSGEGGGGAAAAFDQAARPAGGRSVFRLQPGGGFDCEVGGLQRSAQSGVERFGSRRRGVWRGGFGVEDQFKRCLVRAEAVGEGGERGGFVEDQAEERGPGEVDGQAVG